MKIRVLPGAAVPAVLLFLAGKEAWLSAVLAVVVHECGHLLAICLLGGRPERLTLGAAGLMIDYRGVSGAFGRGLAAAAGPAAGVLLYFAAETYPVIGAAGELSLTLSLFNLLPAQGLDGGNIILAAAEAAGADGGRIITMTGILSAAALAITGGVLFVSGGGGAWMIFLGCALFITVVKNGKMV